MSSLYTKIKKNFVKAFVRHSTPRAGRKAGSMNMLRLFASFGGTRSRAYGAGLVAMLAALFLAACGGGGGGTVVTPHDAAVTIGSTDPANGATGVALDKKLTVNYTIGSGVFKQATSTLTCGGIDVPSTFTREGNSIITTATSELPVEKTCTLRVGVVAKSTDGGMDATASADVSFTTKGALRYGEMVFAGTGALPLRIIRNGNGTFTVEQTANLTGYTEGGIPLTHCAHYIDEDFFTDGRKLWNCRTFGDVWRNLYLDPAENALHAYNGPAPTRTLPVDPNWIEQQEGTPVGTSAYTATSYGELFTRNTDSGVVLFEDLTGAVTTILSGDQLKPEESIRFLVTLSNP